MRQWYLSRCMDGVWSAGWICVGGVWSAGWTCVGGVWSAGWISIQPAARRQPYRVTNTGVAWIQLFSPDDGHKDARNV